MIDAAFWNGRRVLVTGHTGFKGSWLCAWLLRLGARVTGIGLEPDADPSLFRLLNAGDTMASAYLDVRDRDALAASLLRSRPNIIVHMAAQPLVRRGIRAPFETFSTNVLGLVNLLDAARALDEAPAIVVVTSDKVYAPDERDRAHVESDALGGDDPYSASKACAEIVAAAYRTSLCAGQGPAIATARAGNVIGGGDWSEDRLVPDLVRAIGRNERPVVRNPDSTRPWQHVLDALSGYLLLAQAMQVGARYVQEAWNFGPLEREMPTVAQLTEQFLAASGTSGWTRAPSGDGIERKSLRVDSTKARTALGWRSRLSVSEAVTHTAKWYARHATGEPAARLVEEQIRAYEALE